MTCNIERCNKCNTMLIAEEFPTHECFKPKSVWVIDGRVWLGDGTKYYRYFPPTNLNNQKKQPDNEHKKTLSSTIAL